MSEWVKVNTLLSRMCSCVLNECRVIAVRSRASLFPPRWWNTFVSLVPGLRVFLRYWGLCLGSRSIGKRFETRKYCRNYEHKLSDDSNRHRIRILRWGDRGEGNRARTSSFSPSVCQGLELRDTSLVSPGFCVSGPRRPSSVSPSLFQGLEF